MTMNLLENPTLKRLADNFLSLFVLQFINYLLPLILIPYLIRVLGVDGFGIYSFILAIMLYGLHMSDYGFELSATYHIARNKEHKDKINTIISAVFSIKIMIALFYLVLITLGSLFIDKLQEYQNLLFLSYGMIIGQLFFPVWFFQGMEKMRYIMYLNGISKLLFVLSILIFVQESSDLYLALFLNALSSLILGALSLYVLIYKFQIKFKIQKWVKIVYYLKDGWYLFTSKFAVQLYTTFNMILLGFFASPMVVGYYAIAVKIIEALGGLLEPLTRAVYPYLINVQKHSSDTFFKRNQQLSIVILLVMLPVSLLLIYFSEFILELLTGKEAMPLNIEILQTFALTLIVYLYGSQFTNMLVTLKKTKILNLIVFSTAGLNLFFAPIVLYFFGVIGMVWLMVVLVFILTLSKGFFLLKYSKQED